MELTFEDLLEASKKCKRNVAWKSSTQMYTMNRLMWAASTKKKLNNGTYTPKRYNEFKIHERGKLRTIRSVHISDRVVQKAFNEKTLKPKTYPSLINRNCASQPGKGTTAQLEGLKEDLRRHYRKYGRKGYVLLIDFTNYFGNIDKEILTEKTEAFSGGRKSIPAVHKGRKWAKPRLGSQSDRRDLLRIKPGPLHQRKTENQRLWAIHGRQLSDSRRQGVS